MKEFYHRKRVIVTGGCGFIGSHLVHALVALGAQVTIIDDLSTGSLDTIASIKDHVTFLQASIVDYEACLAATKDADIIFHLAAFISVPLSLEQPQACHRTNVDGLVHILEAARINGVKRLTFSSSAAVYGTTHELCSEQSPTKPESPYGYSKLIGELYCQQYAQNFGINTVILRYFNVYGPGQNPNGAYAAVVAKFMYHMRHNEPITIFGNGLQTRDFVPVSHVVQANLFLAMHAQEHKGNVFNIATGKSITLLELFEQLKAEFPNYAHEPRFMPARAGDVPSSQADCNKYQKITAQHTT